MEMIGTLDEPEPYITAGASMVRDCINEGKGAYAFNATVAECKTIRTQATVYAKKGERKVRIYIVERGKSGPPFIHRYNLVVSPANPTKGTSND